MCTCLDDYAAWRRARGDGYNTLRARVGAVRRCAEHAGVDPCQIATTHMIDHLDRPLAPQTRQCYVIGLRAWGQWLVRSGHRTDDPAVDLPRPRVPRGVPRPVPESAIGPLLEIAAPRVRAMLALAAYAGLRVHEIAKIRGEDVTCDTLYVHHCPRAHRLPGDRRREPVAGARHDLGGAADHRMGGQHRSHPALPLGRLMTYAMRDAGVTGSPHHLRHRYGTAVLKGAGGNLRVAPPATTSRFQ